MTKEKIAVLFGGRSIEHEISIITANQIMKAMDTKKFELIPVYLSTFGKWYTGEALVNLDFYRKLPKSLGELQKITLLPDPTIGGFLNVFSQKVIPVDVCLLSFHGQYGEDGCIQGLLELADLPYTGSSVMASSVSMNKHMAKLIAKEHGIATLPSCVIRKSDAINDFKKQRDKIFKNLSHPLVIKPNHLGSSIGVSKADNAEELSHALAKVFHYDDQALIEPALNNMMEINVAILEGSPPYASAIEIPLTNDQILSYESKYLEGRSKTGSHQGMASLQRAIDPCELDLTIKNHVIQEAKRCFLALSCSGVCRFDFMFDKVDGKIYFNEVNPIPGSFAYYLWANSKPPILLTELIERLLILAKQRKSWKRSLNTNREFLALNT